MSRRPTDRPCHEITANLETKMSRFTHSLGPVPLLLLSAGAAAPVEPLGVPVTPPEPLVVVGDPHKVHYPQFTADSKSVAVMDSDGRVRLYDLAARKYGPVVMKNQGVTPFTLSPCGRFLVVACEWLPPTFRGPVPAGFRPGGINLVLWDVKTGQPVASTPFGKKEDETQPLFAPDGGRVYFVNPDNAVGVWDTAKRAVVGTLEGPPTRIAALALSPDGKRLAVASLADGPSGRLDIWDTAKAERVHTFELQWCGYRIAFLPDGKTLLATGAVQVARNPQGMLIAQYGIRRFDVAAGTELNSLPLPRRLARNGAAKFRLSPDGRTGLLICRTGGLYLIDPQTGKEVGPGWIRDIGFREILISPDGKYVAGTGGSEVYIYTTESLLKAK